MRRGARCLGKPHCLLSSLHLHRNHNQNNALVIAEKLNFSSVVWKEEDPYVAWCPDLDTASHAKTIEESLENLKEAIELHLQDEEATTPKKQCPINHMT